MSDRKIDFHQEELIRKVWDNPILARLDERVNQIHNCVGDIKRNVEQINGRVKQNERDILTAKTESRSARNWIRGIIATGTIGAALKWFFFDNFKP